MGLLPSSGHLWIRFCQWLLHGTQNPEEQRRRMTPHTHTHKHTQQGWAPLNLHSSAILCVSASPPAVFRHAASGSDLQMSFLTHLLSPPSGQQPLQRARGGAQDCHRAVSALWTLHPSTSVSLSQGCTPSAARGAMAHLIDHTHSGYFC